MANGKDGGKGTTSGSALGERLPQACGGKRSRLFCAIPIVGKANAFVAATKRAFRARVVNGPSDCGQPDCALASAIAGLSLADARNVHLTLSFLGNVDNALIPALKADISNVSMPDVQLSFAGPGTFVTGPRDVVAVLTLVPTKPLLELKKRVDEAAARHVPVDRRSYRPHITIARIRFGESVRAGNGREQVLRLEACLEACLKDCLKDCLETMPLPGAREFFANRFALYRSVHEQGRMRHDELVSVRPGQQVQPDGTRF